jgi:hypothetical protein
MYDVSGMLPAILWWIAGSCTHRPKAQNRRKVLDADTRTVAIPASDLINTDRPLNPGASASSALTITIN